MSDRATLQAELLLLCGKVRDDTLTPGDAARLDELLQADSKAMQLYVRYMSVVSLLESRGMGQRVTSEEPEQSETIDHNVFAELLELESKAEAELVEQTKPIRLFVPNEKTPWQIGGALRWTAQQPAVWSGAAAVFVIAVVLFFVFNGGEASQPIADQPDPTSEPGRVDPAFTPAPSNIVATLTAERDAVWKQPGGDVRPGALRPGTPLSAGQRLTLTQGFAEITTNRGAIAILEAPATIELLNNNALHLHTGKLVGICETESSKGFLVRTPHLDITDLGTRFGVSVKQSGETISEVFEGSVMVQPSAPTQSGFQKRILKTSDRLTLDATGLPTTQSVEASDFSSILFQMDGIASIEGQMSWYPGRLDLSDNEALAQHVQIAVMKEVDAFRLKKAMPLTLREPGRYRAFDMAEPATTLPAGTVIRAYWVALGGRKATEKDSKANIKEGRVKFDSEVLGIVTSKTHWDAFDPPSIGPTRDPIQWNDLNIWPEHNDQIEIHEDRRTIDFRFWVETGSDLALVVLREKTGDQSQP